MPPLHSGPLTAAQLPDVRIPGKQVELVRGTLIVKEPPGYLHSTVTARLAKMLMDFVDPRDLGDVGVGDPGFLLATDPDTVRGPDIAFVRRERVPTPPPTGYAAFAPDLAVEILSPHDRPGEILAKVGDWLEAGVRLVWVIDPARRTAHVYRADGTQSVITADGDVEGEDVLPGFGCPVRSIV